MNLKTAVLPAGGLGTRFLPATKATPKEMLPVLDKPLIQYAVEEALMAGIERFIIVTGKGKNTIEDHFDRAHHLDAFLPHTQHTQTLKEKLLDLPSGAIVYVRQDRPLGLGHALWCARDILPDAFAVLLADDLMLASQPTSTQAPNDLSRMIKAHESMGGHWLATTQVPDSNVHKYGILEAAQTKEQARGIVQAKRLLEKPQPHTTPSRTAIIGRYILSRTVVTELERMVQQHTSASEIQLTTALDRSLETTPLFGLATQDARFDCGSVEGMLEATLAVAAGRPSLNAILQRHFKEKAA